MKTLKSYLAGFVQVGLAAGIPIFGHFRPDTSRPVLGYVGEGGRIPYTRRLRRIAAAMGVDLEDIPLELSFDVAAVQSPVFQESLARDLTELEPRLVVVDPLYAFHGAQTKASDLHAEGALLNAISKPCGDAGASLMVVNHFNQGGAGLNLKRITIAGSGEWADEDVPPVVELGGGLQFRLYVQAGCRNIDGGRSGCGRGILDRVGAGGLG